MLLFVFILITEHSIYIPNEGLFKIEICQLKAKLRLVIATVKCNIRLYIQQFISCRTVPPHTDLFLLANSL